MIETQDAPSDVQELHELQLIIERLASGEISDSEAKESLARIWNAASKESMLDRVLRELFPSLYGGRQ